MCPPCYTWPVCLCSARSQLPLALPMAVDRCHHLTLQAAGRTAAFNSSSLPGSPAASPAASPARINVYGVAHRPHTSIPGMLFADVMQQVYNVGLVASQRGITSAARRCLWPQDAATHGTAASASSAASSTGAGSWQGLLSSASSRDAAAFGSALGSSSSRSSRVSSRELALHYQDLTWWLTARPEVRGRAQAAPLEVGGSCAPSRCRAPCARGNGGLAETLPSPPTSRCSGPCASCAWHGAGFAVCEVFRLSR
jgi:hypothetical protein